MVGRRGWALLFVFLSLTGFGFEPEARLRLEIFSHQVTREIILTSQDGKGAERLLWLGPGRLSVGGRVFEHEVVFQGPARLESGKTLRLSEGSSRVRAGKRGLVAVVELSPTSYLAGILAAESGPWSGLAPGHAINYLKAQAVVSRSYALYYRPLGRHPNAEFCDSTHCQAWTHSTNPIYREAVIATDREILSLDGRPAPCYYSSTAGPTTLLPSEVWGSNRDDRFFSRVPTKNLQKASPHASWTYELPWRLLDQILENNFGLVRDSGPIRLERTGAGSVARIHFGREALAAEEFRLAVCRATDWGSLRSLWFELEESERGLSFKGRGLGHGVGLCQYGALELARQGRDYREILGFYYPKLRLIDSR